MYKIMEDPKTFTHTISENKNAIPSPPFAHTVHSNITCNSNSIFTHAGTQMTKKGLFILSQLRDILYIHQALHYIKH